MFIWQEKNIEHSTSNTQHRTLNMEVKEPLTLSLSPEYWGEGTGAAPESDELQPGHTVKPLTLSPGACR